MKIELLVSTACSPCQHAEQIWARVAATNAISFQVHDIASARGEAIQTAFNLQTVPAVLIDGMLKGVGVQSTEDAMRMIAACKPK